jgi:ADYC domain
MALMKTKNTVCSSAASARGVSLCLAAFALLGAACGGPAAEVEAPGERRLAAEIHENQGTTVLGTTPSTLSVTKTGAFDADGNAISNIEVVQGGLSFTVGGVNYSGPAAAAKIDGAHFVASDGSILTVNRVCRHYSTPEGFQYNPNNAPSACNEPENGKWPKEPNPGEYEYAISVKSQGSTSSHPLCSDGWNRAMPIAGTWTEEGLHLDKGINFSFACNGSTVVKCINWDYKPWVSAERHQACTRMAVADYCGNGNSHTLEGTLIGLWDNVSINPFVGEAEGFEFEAGWLPEGALCMRQKRWSIFPIGYCGDSLIDPRSNGTVDDGFCHNENVAQSRPGGNSPFLLFNESANYEAGLYTWGGPAGLYTTTEGFYGGVRPSWTTAPYDKLFALAEYEGIVFRDKLTGTTKLRSCWLSQQGPFVTTTRPCPSQTVAEHHEGFVYPPEAPPTNLPPFLQNLVRPLIRHCFGQNGQGGCMTTTRDLSPALAALDRTSTLEGHIIVYEAK